MHEPELITRIERLERANRFWSRAAGIAVLVAVCTLLMGQSRRSPDLEVSSLSMLNNRGQTVMHFYTNDDGEFRAWMGRSGEPKIMLGAGSSHALVSVADVSDSKASANLGCFPGKAIVSVEAPATSGTASILCGSAEDSPQGEFKDRAGNVVWRAPEPHKQTIPASFMR
jgi:hypothetical protein